MGKSILGCTKNDFLLDPREPEGERYYAENPNLLYLIRQSYGGKYPNNDEGTGDTPWTTMPNCVAYAWARCMEIWVPLIEDCPEYYSQNYREVFNNGHQFADGLDYLRKVYKIDRLAQSNGEDMISNMYSLTDLGAREGTVNCFHLDYLIPWKVDYSIYSHGANYLIDSSHKTLDIYAADNASYNVTLPTLIKPVIESDISGFTEIVRSNNYELRRVHPNSIHELMWNSSVETSFFVPQGSIMVYGSGLIHSGRAGHAMVIEDGSPTSEVSLWNGTREWTFQQLVPTISDANIPHGNWGRTIKYYNWPLYAGSMNLDKIHHVYRAESDDLLEGIILPPFEIITILRRLATSPHRIRFGKTNLLSPKTLRRIHAGYRSYEPEQ